MEDKFSVKVRNIITENQKIAAKSATSAIRNESEIQDFKSIGDKLAAKGYEFSLNISTKDQEIEIYNSFYNGPCQIKPAKLTKKMYLPYTRRLNRLFEKRIFKSTDDVSLALDIYNLGRICNKDPSKVFTVKKYPGIIYIECPNCKCCYNDQGRPCLSYFKYSLCQKCYFRLEIPLPLNVNEKLHQLEYADGSGNGTKYADIVALNENLN